MRGLARPSQNFTSVTSASQTALITVERRVNVGGPLPPGISERRYEELLMNAANAPKHPETLAAMVRAKARGGQPGWAATRLEIPWTKSLEVASIPFQRRWRPQRDLGKAGG